MSICYWYSTVWTTNGPYLGLWFLANRLSLSIYIRWHFISWTNIPSLHRRWYIERRSSKEKPTNGLVNMTRIERKLKTTHEKYFYQTIYMPWNIYASTYKYIWTYMISVIYRFCLCLFSSSHLYLYTTTIIATYTIFIFCVCVCWICLLDFGLLYWLLYMFLLHYHWITLPLGIKLPFNGTSILDSIINWLVVL